MAGMASAVRLGMYINPELTAFIMGADMVAYDRAGRPICAEAWAVLNNGCCFGGGDHTFTACWIDAGGKLHTKLYKSLSAAIRMCKSSWGTGDA